MTVSENDTTTESADDVEELHIGADGLWIPSDLREFDRQIVFRTPRASIQHFTNDAPGELDAYYGMIDASNFGDPDDMLHPKNPELAPNRVSIKPEGEPAQVFPVETDPDVRCDGGTETVLYLTTLECTECTETATVAHDGVPRAADNEPPWPKVRSCPHCETRYPDHLDDAIVGVSRAERIDPAAACGDNRSGDMVRHPDAIEDKIDELIAYDDYGTGSRHQPGADRMRRKHQGWIDALRWVLGSDLGVEP